MEFAQEGGEGATPYEVLLHAALVGDSTHFTRQDSVEATWRIVQPLLESPPRVRPYEGLLGPAGGGRAGRRFRRLALALARRLDDFLSSPAPPLFFFFFFFFAPGEGMR